MPENNEALGRLIANENSASDLLAVLFERDPAPLIRVLGLPDGEYRVRREGKAARSRFDLVVYREDHPVAVLELKGASTEHGDQLDRYRAWAAKYSAALFYCTLDRGDVPPDPWRAVGLVELYGAWRDSSDPHAAWLGGEIAGLFASWDRQAEGVIGESRGWYVPDLVTRRVALDLDRVLRERDGQAEATRTNPGNPMFLAWRRHPNGDPNAWIGVDVRSGGRKTPAARWLFRPCVQVELGDGTALEARRTVHDLAVALLPAMVLPAIQRMLTEQGRPELGQALSANQHGGLARPADAAVLEEFRNGELSESHPVFRNDWNRRLATQLTLDVTKVDRFQLADLTLAVLDHLVASARELVADQSLLKKRADT